MAYPRVEYIPEITYEHRNNKGIRNMSEEWDNVANIVKENNPGILPLSKESYCLYQTKENARLVLEMGNW